MWKWRKGLRSNTLLLVAALSVALGIAGGPDAAPAAGRAESAPLRVHAFYVDGPHGWARLRQIASRLDVVAPSWYVLDPRRAVVLGRPPDRRVRGLAARTPMEIWPVVNAQLDGWRGFARPAARARLVRAVLRTARVPGYDGLTLDIEGVAVADARGFSRFVATLAGALHRRGQRLAVYVPRKTFSPPSDWSRPFRWHELARSADLVLASSYSEAWEEPGPLVTEAGFGRLLDYASSVSPERVAPVLGALGLTWRPGRAPAYLTSREAGERRRALRVPADGRDGGLEYRDAGATTWYESGDGLERRARAAGGAGLSWVSLFPLGAEPRSFWASLGPRPAPLRR